MVHGNGCRVGSIGSISIVLVLLANARFRGRCIIVVVIGRWFVCRSHHGGGGGGGDVGILVFVTAVIVIVVIVIIITGGGEAVVAMSRLDEACNHVHGY